MVEFIATNNTLISSQKIEVAENVFNEFINEKKILSRFLENEILFDQIIESYWDYKNKVDYWRLRSVSKPTSYILNHDIRSSLNRLAFNLLNLGKMYLDIHYNEKKIRCFAVDLIDDSNCRSAVIKQRDEIYELNPHYVIGCKLRANSQHSTLPVSRITTGLKFSQEDKSIAATFKIPYEYSALLAMGVSKKVLTPDKKYELTEILDGYVYAIAQMHDLNRQLTESRVNQARQLIKSLPNKLMPNSPADEYSFAFEISSEWINADIEWFSVADHLLEKHKGAVKYASISFS